MVSRRVYILSLIVVAVVVYLLPRPWPEKAMPARSQLPIRKTTSCGVEATLASLERLPNGQIRARLSFDFAGGSGPGTICPDELSIKDMPFATVTSSSTQTPVYEEPDSLPAPGDEPASSTAIFNVPDSGSVTLVQTLHVDRPGKHVNFRFNGLTPRSRDVQLSRKGAQMTVLYVSANQEIDAHKWEIQSSFSESISIPSGKCFGVIVKRALPPGYTSDDIPKLLLGSRTVEPLAVVISAADQHAQMRHIESAFRKRIGKPTAAEKLVGRISPGTAAAMMSKRAGSSSSFSIDTQTAELCMYVFPSIDPLPKTFSLELSGILPPAPADRATVTFDQVRVPVQ